MNKIEPIKSDCPIDYSDKIINNLWEECIIEERACSDMKNVDFVSELLDNIENGVVCVQSESVISSNIIEKLYDCTKRKNRIYLLSNNKEDILENLAGSCLIRYGINNIGSIILVNPNTDNSKGCLLATPLAESDVEDDNNLLLKLNSQQINKLFRFFCNNFWNKAEYEIIDDFEKPSPAGDPPLDFLPPLEDYCNSDYLKKEIETNIQSAKMISIPEISDNSFILSDKISGAEIITGLSGNDTDFLNKLAAGNDIYSVSNNKHNPCHYILTDETGWLIPKSRISNNDNLFGLRLDENQYKFVNEKYEFYKNKINYKYSIKKTRNELRCKKIILQNQMNNLIEIKEKNIVDYGIIPCSKFLKETEFKEVEPEFSDDGVSCLIQNEWEVVPFYTPEGSRKDDLYRKWESADDGFSNKLKRMNEAIVDVENEKKSFSDIIRDRLKRFFLSKDQTFKELKNETSEMEDINISNLDKTKRNDYIKKINNLIYQINNSISEIAVEKDKTEKLIKWENRKEKLLKQLGEKNDNLGKVELQIIDLEKYLKNNAKDINDKEDIEIKKNRDKDDLKKKRKEKSKLISEKNNLEQDLENIGDSFNYKKEIKGSDLDNIIPGKKNKKRPNQNGIEIFVLDSIEELPSVGVLKTNNNNKYLEIIYWEEAEFAENEAKRLNAELSVKVGE